MSMGVLVNHAIAFATSPLAVSLFLILAGLIVTTPRPKKSWLGHCLVLIGLAYLWFMSSGLAYRWMGLSLEREFPPQRVEDLPSADAIVILGGGMGGNTNTVHYPELYPAADRVAHAARIWKAGKAPLVMASGTNELVATVPFLLELGVPQSAIRVENKSGNTEENARFVAATLAGSPCGRGSANCTERGDGSFPRKGNRGKVFLVTSSWHMRRALLMFRKYAPDIEVIPAACDYEATIGSDEFHLFGSLLPNADCLLRNSYMLKEIIGYWGYRLLR